MLLHEDMWTWAGQKPFSSSIPWCEFWTPFSKFIEEIRIYASNRHGFHAFVACRKRTPLEPDPKLACCFSLVRWSVMIWKEAFCKGFQVLSMRIFLFLEKVMSRTGICTSANAAWTHIWSSKSGCMQRSTIRNLEHILEPNLELIGTFNEV